MVYQTYFLLYKAKIKVELGRKLINKINRSYFENDSIEDKLNKFKGVG